MALGVVVLGALATVAAWRLEVPRPVAATQLAALGAAIAAAAIDARQLRLPDKLTYPLAGAGVLAAVIFQIVGWQHGLLAGLACGAAYSLILLAMALLIDVRMYGLGDVKLAAGLGVWLGALSWDRLVAAFIAAQLILLLCVLTDRAISHRVRMIPAGPAMVAGAVLAVLTA